MKKQVVRGVAILMSALCIVSGGHIYGSLYQASSGTLVAQAAHTDDFINKIGPLAVKDMKESGILASITIAQAILESGWGRSRLATEANNYFGIKASPGWSGGVTNMTTSEYEAGRGYYTIVDGFRKYSDLGGSLKDHSTFLLVNSRYNGIQYVTDPLKAITLIHNAGYATDPSYVTKIMSLVNGYNLTRFDKQALAELEAGKQAKEAEIASTTTPLPKVEEEVRELEEVLHEFEEESRSNQGITPIENPENDTNVVSSQDSQIDSIDTVSTDTVINGATGEKVDVELVEQANEEEVAIEELLEERNATRSTREVISPTTPKQTQPTPEQAQPTPEEAQPTPEEVQPTPKQAQPTPEEAQSTPKQAQPTSEVTQSTPEEAQPTPEEAQTTPEEAQPTPEQAQPTPVLTGTKRFVSDKEEVVVVATGIDNNLSLRARKVASSTDVAYEITFVNDKLEVESISNIDATVTIKLTDGKMPDKLYFIDSNGQLHDISGQIIQRSDKEITFKTTHFSIYGIKYVQATVNKAAVKAPKTGDFANYILYIIIVIVCIIGIIYLIVTGKKKNRKNKK